MDVEALKLRTFLGLTAVGRKGFGVPANPVAVRRKKGIGDYPALTCVPSPGERAGVKEDV